MSWVGTTCTVNGPVSPSIRRNSCSAASSSDRVGILRDDGHRRVEQVGEQEVVEADQGHLVLAAEPAQCPHAHRSSPGSGR